MCAVKDAVPVQGWLLLTSGNKVGHIRGDEVCGVVN